MESDVCLSVLDYVLWIHENNKSEEDQSDLCKLSRDFQLMIRQLESGHLHLTVSELSETK